MAVNLWSWELVEGASDLTLGSANWLVIRPKEKRSPERQPSPFSVLLSVCSAMCLMSSWRCFLKL